jgi:ribosomal protein L32
MSKLQERAEKAWSYVEHDSGCCKIMRCGDCFYGPDCDGEENVEQWLLNHGFPARRPHIYTIAELGRQFDNDRTPSDFAHWAAEFVEAVECPNCKETLYRNRTVICGDCGSVYPADKWSKGLPCDCGSMRARYSGRHSNWFGFLEFHRCKSLDCWWNDPYRPLTMQGLADVVQEAADKQQAIARTCPDCGDASGNDQMDGVYLPIEECECGWRK